MCVCVCMGGRFLSVCVCVVQKNRFSQRKLGSAEPRWGQLNFEMATVSAQRES